MKRKLAQTKEVTTKKAQSVGENGADGIHLGKSEAPIVGTAIKRNKNTAYDNTK